MDSYSEKFAKCGFSTKAIHIGSEPNPMTGEVVQNISMASTFAQREPAEPYGKYDYIRAGNPTKESLEKQFAALENARYSLAFSSGLSATDIIIKLLRPGDEIVSIDDVYGGTNRFFRKVGEVNYGLKVNFANFQDMEEIKKNMSDKTKLVWFESPTNPTLQVVDVEMVCKTVKAFNSEIIVVMDCTFLSPYNINALDLGVDIVMHSGTKYIGGHSDILMGIIALNNEEIYKKLNYYSLCTGPVLSPFYCYLASRSLKTLALRMERINSNALAVAKFLEGHSKVEKVLYPGLESSPFYELAKRQHRGNAGIISFYLKGTLENSKNFFKLLKLFILAESLGSVESIAELPCIMTHASVPAEERKVLGISDTFIRLAVGVEEIEDLIEDLDYALNNA